MASANEIDASVDDSVIISSGIIDFQNNKGISGKKQWKNYFQTSTEQTPPSSLYVTAYGKSPRLKNLNSN